MADVAVHGAVQPISLKAATGCLQIRLPLLLVRVEVSDARLLVR
jgi:hypothetical protein